MSNDEIGQRNEAEFAEIAADAEPVDLAKIRAFKMKEYVTSIAHTFQPVNELGTTVGIFMYEGSPYIATFYQTVDNIAEDGWSLDIANIEFVGSTNCVMDATESGWVMLCEEYTEDDED